MGLIKNNDIIILNPGDLYVITAEDVGKTLKVGADPVQPMKRETPKKRVETPARTSHAYMRVQDALLNVMTKEDFPSTGVGVSDLCHMAGLSVGGNVSRILKDMEARGLVQDRAYIGVNVVPTGRRRRNALWGVTSKGREHAPMTFSGVTDTNMEEDNK